MQKWVLALAGWGLISGCGSNDPEGSLRYDPPSSTNQPHAQSSTNTISRNAPEPSPSPTGVEKPQAQPETPKPPETLPPESKDNAKSATMATIPKVARDVDWNLSSLDPTSHAHISRIDSTNLEITVFDGETKVWDAVEVPYKTEFSNDTYAEYHLSQKTWSQVEQSLTFWVKLSTSECELTWEVDGWTSDEMVLMHGRCEL